MAVHIEFRDKNPMGTDLGTNYTEAVASWLRTKLLESGIEVAEPARHDWGVEISIRAKGARYYAGMPARKEAGNWHVFVEKKLNIAERLLGYVTPPSEPMAQLIKEIIAREPSYKVVRVEQKK